MQTDAIKLEEEVKETQEAKVEETKEPENPIANVLKINGKELVKNKNQGLFGTYLYEKSFNRSLTDDLLKVMRAVQDGDVSNMPYDNMLYFRLMFIMSGMVQEMSFEVFLSKVDPKFNFLVDYIELLEKAQETYLPM